MQYILFTDNLADLTVSEAFERSKSIGFEGLDLTVRPGGHVLPAKAEMGLSAARMAADRHEMEIPMATTAITDTDSPHAEDVIASCSHYGIRKIKLGYWRYEPFGKIQAQISDTKKKIERLIKLTRKYDILPCVHVHSGDILANGGSLLYLLLEDFSPDDIGAYADPMHMTVEGGSYGWEIGLDLITPWISLVGIKNFHWIAGDRDERGQRTYTTQYLPLADGQANLPRFMKRLQEIQYDGVISLHSEYKGGSSFRVLTTNELLSQSESDLKYLRTLS